MSEKIRGYLTLEDENKRVNNLDFVKFQEDKQEREGIETLDARTLSLFGETAMVASGLIELDI